MTQFIKAQFDADSRIMTAWTEYEEVEFHTYTQEEHDDYVTHENLTEYLKGASELPEDFDSYEDWADAIFACGDADRVMMDESYCCYWDDICELAGVDVDEIPYSDCCSIRSINWEKTA